MQNRFVEELRERLASGRLQLPTLPDIALRINELAQRDTATAALVASAVSQDPAVAARIVRCANSAGSGGSGKIDNLRAAVTRLGFQMTRALVTRAVMEQMFLATMPGLRVLMQETWQRSIEVAALSRALARHCTPLDPEQAMLAGLLHLIGVLPIIRLADEQTDLLRPGISIRLISDELHPTVGQLVLRAWGFSEEFQALPLNCRNFRRHHAGPPDYADVVTVTSLNAATTQGAAQMDFAMVPAFSKVGIEPKRPILDVPEILSYYQEAKGLLSA